ncbi:ATP-binding protein [Pseudonocardia sp. TMWB2A]
MQSHPENWAVTTHEWTRTLDLEHIRRIQADPSTFARSVWHLLLEVLAYARDEASSKGTGHATVTLHADGTIDVTDNGRGTDTRTDQTGRLVRKPVMATRDVRFFDDPTAELLLDGFPRRGMSVVAGSSDVLVHTNRRHDGAWTQRYEHGLPVQDLSPAPTDGTTGTTVTFRPRPDLPGIASTATDLGHRLERLLPLTVELRDQRTPAGNPSSPLPERAD